MNTEWAIVIIAAVLLIVVGLMVSHWRREQEQRATDRDTFETD